MTQSAFTEVQSSVNLYKTTVILSEHSKIQDTALAIYNDINITPSNHA